MAFRDNDPGCKQYLNGTERTIAPEETIARAVPFFDTMKISRVADLTGLDHIGIPVAAAYRPNARSVSVSQGKGLTLDAARASAIMEAIEGYHGERVLAPLRLGTIGEMGKLPGAIQLHRLARTRIPIEACAKLLWVEGYDIKRGRACWVPLEVVQIDFTTPVVGCSGFFSTSSNGLASGNHILEAVSHAICELVERDANALWQFSPAGHRASRRLDLDTIEDQTVRQLLALLSVAEVGVAAWETTTDIGVPSFICKIADLQDRLTPIPAASGSGCHPRPEIALARAITEAAQGRITRIAAVREDLEDGLYSKEQTVAHNQRFFAQTAETLPTRRLDVAFGPKRQTLAEDIDWETARLADVGLDSVIVVDLTQPEFQIPVVKVIIPGLEGLSESSSYVPGLRAERWKQLVQN